MLIIGDLSGIQDYLFDVANEGGQQARRLRARSFFIQLVAECLALRVLNSAGGAQEQLLFCGAGKFIIEVATLSDAQRQALTTEQQSLSEWLLRETNAQLRLALTISESGDTPQALYENAMQSLQREKLRAWATTTLQENKWQPDWLILQPLDKPCALCQRRTGSVTETNQDTGITRLVCHRCSEDLQLGRALPGACWIALGAAAGRGTKTFQLPGWNVTLHLDRPSSSTASLIQLTTSEHDSAASEPQVIKRALARHIPRDADDRAIEFNKLAEKAQGDKLLAVLKADADSLGTFFNGLLSGATDFAPLTRFSRAMDSFFGITLDREISKFDWELIYTVFAGGDDLLLIGPWDVIFDFAAHANAMFKQKFGAQELTLSAGIAFLKPKQPIKYAVEQAEEILHKAKSLPAPRAAQPKDQLAAFGQIWKWSDHATITQAAKQLAGWVNSGIAERGWLQTLLRLAEWRQGKDDPDAEPIDRMVAAMATARLSYFVARNFPRQDDRNQEKQRLRQWANRLVDDFDAAKNVETIYLSTIVHYALMATRAVNVED
jgi:CRISPR-associated protein Csm1